MNACYVYDFTLKAENINYKDIIIELKKECKKWTFQREKGENTNYEHYQGRIHLITKKRYCQVILWQPFSNHCSWSLTSDAHKDDFNYVEKVATRIDGPWSDSDPPPPYIPRQIRNIQLREWQATIAIAAGLWQPRIINVIIDKVGNIGKSILCTYLRCHNLARIIPAVNDYKDIMRLVCNMPTSKCYICDLPKSCPKYALSGMFSALESLKNGYCWDDRYRFTEKIFDSPNVYVFTNKDIDNKLLSEDRWKLWHVVDGRLEIYNPPESDDETDC